MGWYPWTIYQTRRRSVYLVTWRGTGYRSVSGDKKCFAAMAGKFCHRRRNSGRERTDSDEFFSATETAKPKNDYKKVIRRVTSPSIRLRTYGMERRRLATQKHVGKTATIGSIILT